MNVLLLEQALIAGGYRGWHLHGGLLDDTVTIGRTATGWEVYYSERGHQIDLRVFSSEDEACRYFLDYIRGDTSAWITPGKDS